MRKDETGMEEKVGREGRRHAMVRKEARCADGGRNASNGVEGRKEGHGLTGIERRIRKDGCTSQESKEEGRKAVG